MAQETADAVRVGTDDVNEQIHEWFAGGAGGFVGALLSGAVLGVLGSAVSLETLPTLYGLEPSTAAGWLLYLGHGTVVGMIYGTLSASYALGVVSEHANEFTTGPLVGAATGALLWAVGWSVLLPAWAGAVGVDGVGTAPTLDPIALAALVLFGAVLGVLYPILAVLSAFFEAMRSASAT